MILCFCVLLIIYFLFLFFILYLRCDQHPSCSTRDVFWRFAHEEAEAEHHGSSQVCLWHVSDRLLPVTVLLRDELPERQGSRGDAFIQQVSHG